MRENYIEKLSSQPVVHDGLFVDPSTDPAGAEAALVAANGTPSDLDVPTYDAGTNKVLWAASGAGAMVPTFIASTETFTVPANRQALYASNIDNEGIIDAIGLLIEVD